MESQRNLLLASKPLSSCVIHLGTAAALACQHMCDMTAVLCCRLLISDMCFCEDIKSWHGKGDSCKCAARDGQYQDACEMSLSPVQSPVLCLSLRLLSSRDFEEDDIGDGDSDKEENEDAERSPEPSEPDEPATGTGADAVAASHTDMVEAPGYAPLRGLHSGMPPVSACNMYPSL
jgi:hypothetical protein